MGNFFEDLVHEVMDATMEEADQRVLKVRGVTEAVIIPYVSRKERTSAGKIR